MQLGIAYDIHIYLYLLMHGFYFSQRVLSWSFLHHTQSHSPQSARSRPAARSGGPSGPPR